MRVIKKYKNRKLYDTVESGYTTIGEINDLVKAGEEFVVYDAITMNDITHKTLAEVVFENCRKNQLNSIASQDLAILKAMIKSSDGTFTGYFKDTVLNKN